MPPTPGSARYNIANIAGAAPVAAGLGIDPNVIARVPPVSVTVFDNPGRLERWRIGGADVLLDYAHNPDGLRACWPLPR
jgi:UDP-N-acetylmuramyl tripeptide synthase